MDEVLHLSSMQFSSYRAIASALLNHTVMESQSSTLTHQLRSVLNNNHQNHQIMGEFIRTEADKALPNLPAGLPI